MSARAKRLYLVCLNNGEEHPHSFCSYPLLGNLCSGSLTHNQAHNYSSVVRCWLQCIYCLGCSLSFCTQLRKCLFFSGRQCCSLQEQLRCHPEHLYLYVTGNSMCFNKQFLVLTDLCCWKQLCLLYQCHNLLYLTLSWMTVFISFKRRLINI